ncbi:MAG TPA: nucleotidyltransferase domain-containing protein [Pirellulales bacterium]
MIPPGGITGQIFPCASSGVMRGAWPSAFSRKKSFCYAYGKPHADSDVDLLVIMPARNELDQAFKIRCEVPTQFPMDLIVLRPQNLKWRLEERESFVTAIMTKGKTLYEKNDSQRYARELRHRCRNALGIKPRDGCR